MKSSGAKNRYELPGDPGLITRLYWAIEDFLLVPRMSDRRTFALVIFALVLLWVIIAYAVPGPH